MGSVSSDHPSFDGRDEEDDDALLNGEDEDPSCAPAPGVIAFPADDADGVGSNNEGFIDNYDMLDSVDSEEYTLSEKMVHYVGRHIMPEHWMAWKATLVFHAGATVCQMKPATEAKRHDATLVEYNRAIDALEKTHFTPDSICYFRHGFKGKSTGITGLTLYRYFLDSRRLMRSQILPLFPTNFNTMKSGRGFHETINAALTKEYCKECMTRQKEPMTKEEAELELVPTYWDYKKKPWYFGLAVKIFRRHMQLAPNVNEVADNNINVTVSRAVLKRRSQWTSVQPHGKKMKELVLRAGWLLMSMQRQRRNKRKRGRKQR
jgi:hypothetical protein